MTNGEKIVQLFPNAQVDQGETRIYVWLDHSSTTFDREWWNAEYKEPSKSKIPTGSTTKNDLGVDCISRDEVCRYVAEFVNHEFSTREEEELIDNIITGIERMPSVTPQEPRCKNCKWWKDSDGVYRRGVKAESLCPINRQEVYEGKGYCFLYEPQESEGKK